MHAISKGSGRKILNNITIQTKKGEEMKKYIIILAIIVAVDTKAQDTVKSDTINEVSVHFPPSPMIKMKHRMGRYYEVLPNFYFNPSRLFTFWKYKRPKIFKAG